MLELENLGLTSEQIASVKKVIQTKADSSFKAGLDKGKESGSSTEELTNAKNTIARLEKEAQDFKQKAEVLEKELTPYKQEQQYKQDFEDFKKAGGKADVELSDFNYGKYKTEDGKIDWTKFLEKQSGLKAETLPNDPTLNKQPKVTEIEDIKKEMEEAKVAQKLSNV